MRRSPAPQTIVSASVALITTLVLIALTARGFLYATLRFTSPCRSEVGEIRNFVTTVRATLDLRSVPSGVYRLAIRREGDDWRMFRRASKRRAAKRAPALGTHYN